MIKKGNRDVIHNVVHNEKANNKYRKDHDPIIESSNLMDWMSKTYMDV